MPENVTKSSSNQGGIAILLIFCVFFGSFSLRAMLAGRHLLLNGFVIWFCTRGVIEAFFMWYEEKFNYPLAAMHNLVANISTALLFCWIAFSICYEIFY